MINDFPTPEPLSSISLSQILLLKIEIPTEEVLKTFDSIHKRSNCQ